MAEFTPGGTLTLPAPYAVADGNGALIGVLFVVAMADIANGAMGVFRRNGVFTLAKATGQAWTVGQALYWDNTAKNVTSTAGGNTLMGVAVLAALSADTTGKVLVR
ncbi:DUF2190 family protein [Sphingomonas immobilis]|uniref:DUF2190 family protein n=1 Tax=Sphingomonas immobilis TaxID=3063997 RepID=A0ABT8ZVQ9_9SPHN|nr:DUF2190 family protein [Sphingomonas sp. CA1-15]MDO7841085.1 DUF2190 family protein [Sphingomonas sp. CA1-15]